MTYFLRALAVADDSWKPGDERLITVADATRCSAGSS
jgi:hypothetical protein